MPEEIEVETQELQDTIEELHNERAERQIEAQKNSWTRYIAMTTALLAVFAAIGALQGGAKVNEAMIDQIKAADKWNEYQAARQKEHIYTLKVNDLLDAGAKLPELKEGPETKSEVTPKSEAHSKKPIAGHEAKPKVSEKSAGEVKKPKIWKALTRDKRLSQYLAKVKDETDKEEKLKEDAQELEKESAVEMHHHHRFAYAVAMIQVAIALSAIAALTRIKPVWVFSVVIGLFGIVMFFMGLFGK